MSHKWPWSSVRVIVGILPLPSLPSSPFPSFLLSSSLPSFLSRLPLPSFSSWESGRVQSHLPSDPGVLFLGRVTMDTVIKLFQSYSTFHISKMRASDSSFTGLLWNLSKITCKVCTHSGSVNGGCFCFISSFVIIQISFLRASLFYFLFTFLCSILGMVPGAGTWFLWWHSQSIHCWALLQRKLDS